MTRSLLDVLSPDVRDQLTDAARLRSFEKRETVFHRGDPGDSLLLVESGRVAIQVATPQGDTATLALVAPGELFGELAVLDELEPRSATAVALEATTVWSFHRDVIDRVRREHRAVDRFIILVLAQHVRRTSQLLVEALYLPAEPRVRRRVTELVEAYAEESREVEVPLTQDEIAQLAGTSRATVNKVLRAAEDRGLIIIKRGRIIVLSPERIGARPDGHR